MRLSITFSPAGSSLRLPTHYNRLLQASLYANLDQITAAFFHDRGFLHGSRSFKVFTFSRLMGPYEINAREGVICFNGSLKLVVSSPSDDFCGSLATCLLARGSILLGKEEVGIEKVEVQSPTITGERAIVRTLSPIVVYSTLSKADGAKYTCYFQPGEPEFEEQLCDNLRKKYEAVHGCPAPDGTVRVRPFRQPRMHIVKYLGTVIKGYSCTLQLEGPQALLQLGLDAGFGAKNSQGFGCVELCPAGAR